MWKLLDLYWNGLVRYLVVPSALIILLSTGAYSKTECTETEIIRSKEFGQCLSQLEKCDKNYFELKDQLQKCKLDKEEDKVLFFFEASDVNAFMIGIVAGAVLIR